MSAEMSLESEMPDDDILDLTGIAQLVVLENGNFSGHLICMPSRRLFGLMGVGIAERPPAHDCCRPDVPDWDLDLSIIDFQSQKEYKTRVIRSGGDLFKLASPSVSFVSTSIKSGTSAHDHIRLLFPSQAHTISEDAAVCIGEMSIKNLSVDDGTHTESGLPSAAGIVNAASSTVAFSDQDLLEEEADEKPGAVTEQAPPEQGPLEQAPPEPDALLSHSHVVDTCIRQECELQHKEMRMMQRDSQGWTMRRKERAKKEEVMEQPLVRSSNGVS